MALYGRVMIMGKKKGYSHKNKLDTVFSILALQTDTVSGQKG